MILLIMIFVIPLALVGQEVKQGILDALARGDTVKAVELLGDEIKLDPSYEYNYLTLGNIYLSQGKLDKAEEQYQLSVDKNKNFFPGLYALGLVELRQGKIAEAEKAMAYGLKKSKDMEAYFHNAMGLVYSSKGDYSQADGELRKAVLLDSAVAEFHINLADINMKMKVYAAALDEYESAIRLDTTSLDVYFHLAEACLEMKDYSCALEKLNIVLRKDSTHADAWMKAGGIYYKAARSSKDLAEAKEYYKSTIGSYKKFFELTSQKPDSANGRAYYETAMSYLMIGGFAEAKENFATVLAIPVEPKDIFFYYGRALQGNNDFDSALAYYQKHRDWAATQGENLSSAVRDAELYARMGDCYLSKEDRYNEIECYKKSLEYDSTQARLLYGLAVAYNYLQDYRNALIYYMKRIALGPDENWQLYYNAAMAALYLADKGVGVSEMEDIGLDSTQIGAVQPVDPLEGIDLPKLAAQYLEKVTGEYWDKVIADRDNMPTAIRAVNMLGSTYLYQLRDCENGIKNFERVLTIDAQNIDAFKSLGYAYFGGICPNNYGKALTYLNKALEYRTKAEGKCKDPDILLWIGQTYQFKAYAEQEAKQKEQAKADYKSAHDWFLDCLKCDPGNKAAIEGEKQTRFMY